MYESAARQIPPEHSIVSYGCDFRRKMNVGDVWAGLSPHGTVIAKDKSEIEGWLRINRVKLEIAVSGSFGGGVLSQKRQAATSFGGTELTLAKRNRTSKHCEAADPVLKGLGGASREDQQPALVFSRGQKRKALGLRSQPFFTVYSPRLADG